MTSTPDLLEKLILAAIGPIGAVLIGYPLLNRITEKGQSRREDYSLRHELITQMTECANALFFLLQEYNRGVGGTQTPAHINSDNPLLDVHAQYRKMRTRAYALESRLKVYFHDDRPWSEWHRCTDLLSTLYHNLTAPDEIKARVRMRNACQESGRHSGLKSEDLAINKLIIDEYWNRALPESINAVLSAALAVGTQSVRGAKHERSINREI